MHVFSRTPSGLVVAEHAVDERQVAQALRAHDDDLRLIRAYDEDREVTVWKVYVYRGPDRDAVFLFAWTHDDLSPRPLSMNLVEKAKELDLNTRRHGISADEHNRRLVEQQRKSMADNAEAVAEEFAPYLDRGRTIGEGTGRQGYMRNRHLPKAARQ